MADNKKTFMIEGARIVFRNFAGKEGQYNREGDRNFAVILPQDTADILAADGWNVKYLTSRDENESDTPYLSIAVNFKNRPPRVVMLTSQARTNLTEDSVEVLDWAEIENVDLIATPYEWSVNGKTGIKAYLKSLFVTISEDELDLKYSGPAVDDGAM